MQSLSDIISESNDFESEKQRKDKISNTLISFYQTEEGKLSKQVAHAKRSETMKSRHYIASEKKCKGECGEIKLAKEFGKKSAAIDGLQSWCLSCTVKYKADRRKK